MQAAHKGPAFQEDTDFGIDDRTRKITPIYERRIPRLGILLSLLDISEHKKSASMIEHLAHHDTLTGLPNRALFHDRLKVAMAKAGGAANTMPCCCWIWIISRTSTILSDIPSAINY